MMKDLFTRRTEDNDTHDPDDRHRRQLDDRGGLANLIGRWRPVVWAVGAAVLFVGTRLGFSINTPQDQVNAIAMEHAQIKPAIERLDERLQDMSEIVCLFVIQDTGPRDQGDQVRYIRQRCDSLIAADNTRIRR